MDLFQELYELAISEIYDDVKYVKFRTRADEKQIELVSWNLVIQALMCVFTPHLYKTYFRPGIRLLSKEEIISIIAVISKQINEKYFSIEREEIFLMEKAIERVLVSQGWSRDMAWERASYLSREFAEKLTSS